MKRNGGSPSRSAANAEPTPDRPPRNGPPRRPSRSWCSPSRAGSRRPARPGEIDAPKGDGCRRWCAANLIRPTSWDVETATGRIDTNTRQPNPVITCPDGQPNPQTSQRCLDPRWDRQTPQTTGVRPRGMITRSTRRPFAALATPRPRSRILRINSAACIHANKGERDAESGQSVQPATWSSNYQSSELKRAISPTRLVTSGPAGRPVDLRTSEKKHGSSGGHGEFFPAVMSLKSNAPGGDVLWEEVRSGASTGPSHRARRGVPQMGLGWGVGASMRRTGQANADPTCVRCPAGFPGSPGGGDRQSATSIREKRLDAGSTSRCPSSPAPIPA